MLRRFTYPSTPWGQRIEARLLDPNGPSVLGYSTARSNGKTIEAAKIALYYSAGPGATRGFDVLICGPTLSQSGIAWRDAVDAYRTIQPGWKGAGVKIADYPSLKTAVFPWGVSLTAVAGNPQSLTGRRFKAAIIDEPASFPSTRGQRIFNALKTGQGKTPGSKVVACGTRPADGVGHWFEDLLSVSGFTWAAPRDADPLDRKTWALANPSLGLPGFSALRTAIEEEARQAAKSATAMAAFRSLRLNQGVAELLEDVLCRAEEWEAHAEITKLPDRRGPLFLGADLGGGRSMSAVAAYWPQSGRLETVAYFGDIPLLGRREERDGNKGLYQAMHQRGELVLLKGRTTPPAQVFRDAIDRFGWPEVLCCDRYRSSEVQDAGLALGLALCFRGLGFRDSAEDVREFTAALLENRIRTLPTLLLRHALASTLLTRDPAGNPKIVKRGGSRENDAAVATVLAVGEGSRRQRQQPPVLYYQPPDSEYLA